MWMVRTFPHLPFERYADDVICHCKSAEEARALWGAIADRFAACKLVLHPQKTKIVYCKDVNRRSDFPDIYFDFLGFQFRARKIMWVKADRRIFAHSFQPAASPKALTRIGRDIRRWALHHRSDKSLTELAQMYNPCIRGWITYYSHFYKTQLRPTLQRIDAYVIRWARRKFKRMRHQTKGARVWFERLRRANPTLFAHWRYGMATAEHREPCDSRGSCTILGAPGGEIPPGDSSFSSPTASHTAAPARKRTVQPFDELLAF
jgi:RNA-directed DNA polymerase